MADQRARYDEEAVGYGHPTKADVVNRLAMVEHNNDGSHNITYLSDTLGTSVSSSPNVAEQGVASVEVATAGTYLVTGRISGNNSSAATKSIFKAFVKTGSATYGAATQRAVGGAYAEDQNRVTAAVLWIGSLSAGDTIHLGASGAADGGTSNIVGDNDEANATMIIAVKIA